jgi:hypothetical protein
MQEMGLIARVTQVTYRAPELRRFFASGENLRSDGAVPNKKNQVWVADLTYLKVKKQWHYYRLSWTSIHAEWLAGALMPIERLE